MPTPSGTAASTLTPRSEWLATACGSTMHGKVDGRTQAIMVFYGRGFRTN